MSMRKQVMEYYGNIAGKVQNKEPGGCCGSSCCGSDRKLVSVYDEGNLQGLPGDAVEASLGCADPVQFAQLKKGETVLDLGSGGGINVLMSAKHVGSTGMVYGLDMTDEMLSLAEKNRLEAGAENVKFIKGFIENIPLNDSSVDVIISNCVVNLSDDKKKVAQEAFRVLRNGGRLAIADIITIKDISQEVRDMAGMWCSCLGGTLSVSELEKILGEAGFTDIEITSEYTYTKEIITDYFLNDKYMADTLDPELLDMADGAFAGAYIRAIKA